VCRIRHCPGHISKITGSARSGPPQMRLTERGLLRINFRDYPPTVERHLRCNFRCSYCLQRDVEGYAFTQQHFNRARATWDSLATIEDRILVRVNFDGETLADRWAREVCFYISRIPNVSRFEIITNNSIDPKTYLDRLDGRKTSFNCSFHPAQISMERFSRNVQTLKDAGCQVYATMVVTPALTRELPRYSEAFRDQGIRLKPLLLLGLYTEGVPEALRKASRWLRKVLPSTVVYPQAYSRKALAIIRRYYGSELEFKYQYGARTRGRLCYAGVDMVNVYLDGKVLRCFWDEIGTVDEMVSGRKQLASAPYPCNVERCQCPTHMIFLKEFRDRYPLCDLFADYYHGDNPDDVTLVCGCAQVDRAGESR
jgi:hypothetical protein